ncbi:TetR/AcrR family transcriptional regulator [Paenibacillus sambharensis]|uniref:TetR/AcrR family transcriptional regulator n=1 Tax=Paenibacillus sambharensis TaxID=1803190 RepID=A0A2W1LEU5_9BACL|nr:TetR/AcrR family transcriptional regulator [Paenibacillus sambharensis]PZD96560.1 TetR/AcrR family transcriptional regulator [Paenibacillus sambharensis]
MLRESRKKELKEHIFLQALQLFYDKGYEQVTVQEITAKCGIGKGTFFNYFAKKEDILLYLGESQIELLQQSIEKHRNIGHPKEQIMHALNDLLLHFSSHSELMKLATIEIMKSASLAGKESKSVQQLHLQLASMLDRAKQDGKLHSRWETDVIVTTIVGVYFHTILSWALLEAQHTTISESFRKQLDVVWEGIDPYIGGGDK